MTYASEVLADSPAFYLKLDETSGTTLADASGNARDGTLGGSGTTLGSTGLVDGGKAATFNGSGYVTVPYAAYQDASSFTAEAIINATSNGSNYRTIFQKCTYNGTTGDWALWWFTDKLWAIVTRASGTVIAASPVAVSLNARHHVAMTWDGTTGKLYIDGALSASDTTGSGAVTTSSQPIIFAGKRTDTTGYIGVGDEFAFYTSALSATRIAAHAAAMSPRAYHLNPSTRRQAQIRSAHY